MNECIRGATGLGFVMIMLRMCLTLVSIASSCIRFWSCCRFVAQTKMQSSLLDSFKFSFFFLIFLILLLWFFVFICVLIHSDNHNNPRTWNCYQRSLFFHFNLHLLFLILFLFFFFCYIICIFIESNVECWCYRP